MHSPSHFLPVSARTVRVSPDLVEVSLVDAVLDWPYPLKLLRGKYLVAVPFNKLQMHRIGDFLLQILHQRYPKARTDLLRELPALEAVQEKVEQRVQPFLVGLQKHVLPNLAAILSRSLAQIDSKELKAVDEHLACFLGLLHCMRLECQCLALIYRKNCSKVLPSN